MTETRNDGPTRTTQGTVQRGFESVRDAFESADLGQGGAALAAYVDGQLVIDLWRGRARPGRPWDRGTLSNLFSVTKTLAAISMQILMDRGLIDVDAPVSKYWPEFGQAGKEDALVSHILNHSIGVVGLTDADSLLDYNGTGWAEYEEIARRLALSEPEWTPGTQHTYHALTFGWLLGELVRRVDGRTIGKFFRDEVADPLGLDLWIGTPLNVQNDRAASLLDISLAGLPDVAVQVWEATLAACRNPHTLSGRQAVACHGSSVIEQSVRFFGSPAGRSPEVAAANGVGDARSLAKMYALLAAGGELDGVRLVSAGTVSRFSALSVEGPGVAQLALNELMPDGLAAPLVHERWGLGYQINPHDDPLCTFGPNHQAFGHVGLGGQIAYCDPQRNISFAVLRSHAAFTPSATQPCTMALFEALDKRG